MAIFVNKDIPKYAIIRSGNVEHPENLEVKSLKRVIKELKADGYVIFRDRNSRV